MTMSAMLPGAAGPSSSSSSSHLSSTPLAGSTVAQASEPSSPPACITLEELIALLEGQASSSLEALASRGSKPHEGFAGPAPTAGRDDGADGDDSSHTGAQAPGGPSTPVVVGRPEAQQYLAFPATSAKDGDGRGDGGRGGDGRDPVAAGSSTSAPRTIDDDESSRNSKTRLGGEAGLPSLPPPAATPIGSASREAVHNGNDKGINQRPSAASSSPSNRTSLLSPYLPPLPPPYHSSNSPSTAAVRDSGITRRKLIIFDLRPLDAFLQARITGSINIALPSLVVRRMRRSALASLSKATSSTAAAPSTHHLAHLSDYITTTSGKRKFEQALESLSTDDERMSQRSPRSPLDLWRADIVVVVPPPSTAASSSSSSAATSSHEASRALCEALESLECPPHQTRGRNTLFRGDFASMQSSPQAAAFVERGAETTKAASTVDAAALDVPPQSKAGPSSLPMAVQDASAAPAPAPPPKKPPTPPKARPGRPSLARLDTGEKVQTLGSLGAANGSKAAAGGGGGGAYNSAPLRLGATNTSLQVPPSRTAFATPVSGAAAEPATMSLQGLAHMQAKLPPSPASFGDMSLPLSPVASSSSRLTSNQAGRELARRGSDQTLPSPATTSQGTAAAADAAAAGFDVSTVVPSFLYLGPDITTAEEAAQLRSLGIRRILNCAAEVSDKSRLDDGAAVTTVISPLTCLGTPFDRYLKIPMWDNVEAAHVQEDIEQACIFLDEARAANAPVYVHCRAGKSRSVSVVMGWLIHAYKWPLKRAYDYVSERRKDVSPNIGFISCLMAFEELRLRGGGKEGGEEEDRELASGGAL